MEKGKYHMISLMWNLKYNRNEPVKQKQNLGDRKQIGGGLGVGPGRGMEWELLHKLSYVEWINNKDRLYSTGLPRGC